jgi:hypothetical protein
LKQKIITEREMRIGALKGQEIEKKKIENKLQTLALRIATPTIKETARVVEWCKEDGWFPNPIGKEHVVMKITKTCKHLTLAEVEQVFARVVNIIADKLDLACIGHIDTVDLKFMNETSIRDFDLTHMNTTSPKETSTITGDTEFYKSNTILGLHMKFEVIEDSTYIEETGEEGFVRTLRITATFNPEKNEGDELKK